MIFTIETEYKDCPGCGQEISAREALCDYCQHEKDCETQGLCTYSAEPLETCACKYCRSEECPECTGAGWGIDGAGAPNAFTMPECQKCGGTGLIHPKID